MNFSLNRRTSTISVAADGIPPSCRCHGDAPIRFKDSPVRAARPTTVGSGYATKQCTAIGSPSAAHRPDDAAQCQSGAIDVILDAPRAFVSASLQRGRGSPLEKADKKADKTQIFVLHNTPPCCASTPDYRTSTLSYGSPLTAPTTGAVDIGRSGW